MQTDAPTIEPRDPTGPGRTLRLIPVMRILHHPDMRRIGDETAEDLFDASPVQVGRNTPAFGRAALPLGDPCLSRNVLQVEWCATRMGFRVRVSAGQSVSAWRDHTPCDPDGVLLPGTVLELRDRVMLLLTLAPSGRGDALGMVGESVALWSLRGVVESIARSRPRTAFVWGETGTGKELVARALHEASGRGRRGRFVALNCASLEGPAGDDTLLGHVAGAYTGARTARDGAFVEADGGTLFFDEIGELPPDMQARLLRVIETRQVVRLGDRSTASRAVDVLLVFATHRDLAADVAAGRFRADLYGRLMLPRVDVPPLRARRADVPLLFARFLAERVEGLDSQTIARCFSPPDGDAPRIDIAFARRLMSYAWPLNVREVVRWSEWAVAHLASDRRISANDWPPGAEDSWAAHPSTVEAPPPHAPSADSSITAEPPAVRRPAARPTRGALRAALRAHGYRLAATARALSCSRSTVYRWMAEYNLPTAATLDAERIGIALATASGDTAMAAAELEVGERALRLRMIQLGL